MIVIVLGMHRSGTSALAGLLHHNGILMGETGDFHPPPMRENPKGFFENKRFRRINDLLLQQVGYRVKSFDPKIPHVDVPIPPNTLNRMVELIEYYSNVYPHWGFKDPRTCLTLRHWIRALSMSRIRVHHLKTLVMLRKYDTIARSMMARGNRERYYEGQFINLAREYHVRALDTLMQHNIPYINISFDHLIYETNRVIDHINSYLCDTFVTDASFIDPSISKTPPKG